MTGAITLFHVSDVHFGAEDADALAWFADAVAREKPDAVICTGDITMRGSKAEFDAAARWFRALAVPAHIEPGNHDMPYYREMLERLRHPFARFAAFRASLPKPRDVPGVTIAPLWTVTPAQWRLNWSKGFVAPDALIETVRTVQQAPSGLKLVLCHHPLVDADTEGKGSTKGGKAALAVLAAAGADAVLSGHVHDPFDLTIEAGGHPIRLIGAGTISERVRETAPSYNRLEWSAEDGLRVNPVFRK